MCRLKILLQVKKWGLRQESLDDMEESEEQKVAEFRYGIARVLLSLAVMRDSNPVLRAQNDETGRECDTEFSATKSDKSSRTRMWTI